ncbi:MAG: thioredoxin [Candidatus Eremiobacteraeota bacterium]|nr:thioredoxin [Candidatus Eremiobacteraeota bacterium]
MALIISIPAAQAFASGKVGKTTGRDFEKDVLKQSKYVLVDFWAPWCKPCVMMAPELDKVASHYGDKLIVLKLNIDKNKSMASKYKIRGIPTVILYKNGRVVKKLVGYRKSPALQKELDRYLK